MRANQDCSKYYFVNRVAGVWNSIPESCLNTNLIHGFKQRSSKIDFTDTCFRSAVSDLPLAVSCY
jgi:hypothetical protein